MTVKLRPITRDEIAPWSDAMAVGFLDLPDPLRYPFIEAVFDNQRGIAAFDGTRMVGTYASFTTDITMPGGAAVRANAVTGVTVLPTHRGQSILRSAITADLSDAKERGEPLAILFASEFSIYARFGFGVATESISVAIDTPGIEFRSAPGKASSRTVELVDSADAITLCQPVYEKMRRETAGVIDREAARWQQSFGIMPGPEKWSWKGHIAVTRDSSGMIDGFVRYRGSDDWSSGRPSSTLIVDEFVALTAAAHHRLLEFLCSMAWVSKVTIEECPVDDESHLHMVDERRVNRSHRLDRLWARVLDVPRLLTSRTYEGTDRITIDVIDANEFSSGRFALDANPEGVTCERSRGKADVTISVNELASIAFGGLSFAAFVRIGRADEHTAGSAHRVDRLFRTTRVPWNPTHF
jgi:predicted acetyltransferase